MEWWWWWHEYGQKRAYLRCNSDHTCAKAEKATFFNSASLQLGRRLGQRKTHSGEQRAALDGRVAIEDRVVLAEAKGEGRSHCANRQAPSCGEREREWLSGGVMCKQGPSCGRKVGGLDAVCKQDPRCDEGEKQDLVPS